MLNIPCLARVNIGNAQLFSLAADLDLNTNQYNIALAVFFVSYIAFEIPANIIMKRVKPHIFSKIAVQDLNPYVLIIWKCRHACSGSDCS
jgi:hypothetical protein